jgi:hypothetical protein
MVLYFRGEVDTISNVKGLYRLNPNFILPNIFAR